MAPSTSNLKQLLKYPTKCQRLEMFDGQGQLVLIVTQFLVKLCSEEDEIIILLRSLEDSAKLCWIYSCHSEENRNFFTMFWDFITQLKVFFEVPNFRSIGNPNGVVAAFIDLLLEILEEILHRRPYFIHGLVEKSILALKMDLKLLITFLGDTPSQLTELETTMNVLKDIKVVANDVGSFLYSFFLSKDRISIAAMNKSLFDLLGNVQLVKESIEKHCVTVANIWPSDMTPKIAVVSLAFVDSILDYIEDLVQHNDDRVADVKDQIRTIHQNLTKLNNSVKELAILQEHEEYSMQLINVAYEVEYIICSFSSVSYVTLRILQVSEKIIHMMMQLQNRKKNDSGKLEDAEYPRKDVSLPAQRPQIGEDYPLHLQVCPPQLADVMEVAENMTSRIFEVTKEYMSVVEQKYNDLPMYLKPCFLYLGVFEKGKEIPVQKLTMLWQAEGFIGKVEGKSSEDVAQEYLMDLINRDLLLVATRKSDGGIKSCTIIGAMFYVCSRLAEKDNFLKAITLRLSVYEQHHRLSIHSHSIPYFSRPFGLHIRSLLGYLPAPSAFIFSSLKHLKVLDLSTTDLSLYNLTGSEVLVFLRFLAVSSIPSSIEIFKNLEFLFVDNKEVVEIPVILLNMVKLRCVHFSGGAQFSVSWRQATHDESFQTSNLQNFSSIFIYDENDENILRSFLHLRILKCKLTVFWDSSTNRYCYPALNYLEQLESLNISFQPSNESDNISTELISLPSSLRKLTLRNFDLSRRNMKIVGMLPCLEVLKLRRVTIQGKRWNTNCSEFKRLKYLELDSVQIKHWNAKPAAFPSLEKLVLRNCNHFKIPYWSRKIRELHNIACTESSENVDCCTDSIEDC